MAYLNRLIIRIVICWALLSIWSVVSGQETHVELDHFLDSLTLALNDKTDGMDKLKLLDQISYEHYNVDSTFKYATKELELAEEMHEYYYVANAKRFLGWVYFQVDDYERSCGYYQDVIHLCDSLSMLFVLAQSYYGLASTQSTMGNDTEADKYFQKALELYEHLGDSHKISEIYRKRVFLWIEYHLYESAKNFIDKAFAIDSMLNDSLSLAEDFYTRGMFNYKKYLDFENPHYLYLTLNDVKKGYEIEKSHNDHYEIYWMSNKLMFLYY